MTIRDQTFEPMTIRDQTSEPMTIRDQTFEPMCKQCPFRPEAPRAVWDIGQYYGLAIGYHTHDFFCHCGRRGPERERRLCGGWQRAHAGASDVIGDAGAVLYANLRAFEALERGDGCTGSGASVRQKAIKARCPACGIMLPTEGGVVPNHLPPGHPAGGVPAVASAKKTERRPRDNR